MMNKQFCIARWVSINNRPLHIQFDDDNTYINGVSVQWQDETDMIVRGPPRTYYQEE